MPFYQEKTRSILRCLIQSAMGQQMTVLADLGVRCSRLYLRTSPSQSPSESRLRINKIYRINIPVISYNWIMQPSILLQHLAPRTR